MSNNSVKMKQIVSLFAALLMAVTTYGARSAQGIVRKQLFDADWKFSQDSTKWRTVNLPHDWSIEGDFDKDAPAGHDGAFLPTGKGSKEPWEAPMFPNHAAYCGDIDLVGQRKPISHYRSMLWNKEGEQLYMAVREPDGYYGKIHTTMWSVWPTYESWTWPGHEGKNIDVEVYSHYPKVRLYLNDQLVGEKEVAQGMATFTLPYQPGALRAEAGEEKVSLKTAGEAKTIRLTADRTTLKTDGQDLAFITVELTDGNGIVNLIANNELTASVSGSATLIGFGNADIKDCDRYTDSTHKVWKGRALLVVRSTGKKGKATITVQGKGLKTARVDLSFK